MNNSDKFKQYADFGVQDFIQDPFFQDSIIHHSDNKNAFWQEFLTVYTGQRETLEKAGEFLKALSFKEERPEEAQIELMLNKHLQQVGQWKEHQVVRMQNLRRWLRVAAIFGGVILCTAVLYLRRELTITEQTAFGKLKMLMLPDSSEVVLNAHSKLEYKTWEREKVREVWLEGEAFFQVKHRNQNPSDVHQSEKFLLHTKDILIEVLGTSFDVRQRRQKTEVVLQTGSIKISFANDEHPSIFMKPGDVVTYDAVSKQLTQSTTVAENYSSWKEKKLMLLDPSVNEIIRYLEDNFGKKIELQSPQLGESKIEGPILLNNLDDALFVLSTVLKVEITEKNNMYFIRSRP